MPATKASDLAAQMQASAKKQKAVWKESEASRTAKAGYCAMCSIWAMDELTVPQVKAKWRDDDPVEQLEDEFPMLRVYTGKPLDPDTVLFKAELPEGLLELLTTTLEAQAAVNPEIYLGFRFCRRGWWVLTTARFTQTMGAHIALPARGRTVWLHALGNNEED